MRAYLLPKPHHLNSELSDQGFLLYFQM